MINNRKVIGVCVTRFEYRAESNYLDHLNAVAAQNGYKLMVFNSVADFYNSNDYSEGAKSVFSLINYDIVDVLILFSSTFRNDDIQRLIISKAHAHGVPVITIDQQFEGCYCIEKQYGDALKSVINHVIRDHGITDTFFLAGHREDDHTSEFRIQCYKEALAENGLPFCEDRLDYGEYWSGPTKEVMDRLLSDGKQPPRAIICANDYMAITVCDCLREHGFDVPRDVIVTGFGGAADAQYFKPKFTTCIEDFGTLADVTIKVAEDAIAGKAPAVYAHQMKPLISESCGCVSDESHVDDAGHLFSMMQHTKTHERHMLSWLDRMVESEDMDEMSVMLACCIQDNSYLCLRREYITSITKEDDFDANELVAMSRIKEGDPMQMCTFATENMLPDLEQWAQDDTCCIFTSVFVGTRVCGYYAMRTNAIMKHSQNVNRLCKIVNIALNSALNHRRQKMMQESIQRANLVNHITKLPNLKGSTRWFEEFAAKPENHDINLVISVYGIPKHKYIYENYGLKDVEAAVCRVATALQKANAENSFIGHIAEDEFVVINCIDNRSDIPRTINNAVDTFYKDLAAYNAESGIEYYVEVNCGCISAYKGWKGDLASFIKRADAEMYMNRLDMGEAAAHKEYVPSKDQYKKFSALIENNMFSYHFQPIVNAKNGEIFAYEALMRTDASIGMNPTEVLETAGVYNRLYDIQRATMFNVLERFSRDNDSFAKRKVFINSIPGYFLNDSDNAEFTRLYSQYVDDIVIEITEQNTISDEELVSIKNLGGSESGNQIAIDDYGTGHSNIVNLLRYAPHIIKIDRFLITNINEDVNKQMFVRSTIDLARLNNIKVLAEGVETSEELRTVISYGVDYIQGYYTGRPAAEPVAEIPEDIRNEILRANPLFA